MLSFNAKKDKKEDKGVSTKNTRSPPPTYSLTKPGQPGKVPASSMQLLNICRFLLCSSCLAFLPTSLAFSVPNSVLPASMPSKLALKETSPLFLSPEAVLLAETVAPKLGIITSTALYFAPIGAVVNAIRSNDIGELNPIPLVLMSIVSSLWLAYGITSGDPYVLLSNIAGSIGSIGYVVGLLPLLKDDKKQLRMTQGITMIGTAFVLSMFSYFGLMKTPAPQMAATIGLIASGLFVLMAGSPLAMIRKVVSTRNSKSILGSLTGAQVINCALWTAYGFTVKDKFVWGPNVFGFALGMAQLTLKVLFP